MISKPILAMTWSGQSTPGTLTWDAGDACVPSVPWGHDDPLNASRHLHNSPCCSHQKRGFIPHPRAVPGVGGCRGGRCIRMFVGVLSSSSVLLPAPSSPLEPQRQEQEPPTPKSPWMPMGGSVPLPHSYLPPTCADVRVPVSSAM